MHVIRATSTSGTYATSRQYYRDGRTKFDCNGTGNNCTWYIAPRELFTWDKTMEGDEIAFQWVEMDKSELNADLTVKFAPEIEIFGTGAKLTEINATIKYNVKDEDMGQHIAEYCDTAIPISD